MLFLSLLLSCANAFITVNSGGFLNIAHMSSTTDAVDWAIEKGANAIEFDVQYEGGTTPVKVQHSTGAQPCDCICYEPWMPSWKKNENMCGTLQKQKGSGELGCNAWTDFGMYLEHVAKRSSDGANLSLLYFDNKISAGKWDAATARKAGIESATLYIKHLFAKGFRGKIVTDGMSNISANGPAFFEGIRDVFKGGVYESQVLYVFGDSMQTAQRQYELLVNLRIPASQRMFSVGLTACIPFAIGAIEFPGLRDLNDQIKYMNSQQVAGAVIWSIDKQSSMDEYINMELTGIMTNYPGYLLKEALALGKHLANWNKNATL